MRVIKVAGSSIAGPHIVTIGKKNLEIKNSGGVICSDEESISNTFIDYNQSLFTSSQPSNIDVAVEDIPMSITEEMNAWLETEYTRDEVAWALKQMEPLKAPDPMVCRRCFSKITGRMWGMMSPKPCCTALIQVPSPLL